jgi:hypothetical protein
MKLVLKIAFIIFISSYAVKAQYRGGVGDGYAMTKLVLMTPLGLEKNTKNNYIISPNPAKSGGIIQISAAEVTEIQVLDILQKEVGLLSAVSQMTNQTTLFELPMLPTGIYFVTFYSNEQKITQRLFVQSSVYND